MRMIPLRAALEAVGLSTSHFNHITYRANLDGMLEALGADPMDHIPPAPRGYGSGVGRARSISTDAAAVIGVAARLARHGLTHKDALRVALAFVFMGEMGDGLRAIVPADQAAARGPGETFTADLGPTFALVIPARLDAPEARPWPLSRPAT